MSSAWEGLLRFFRGRPTLQGWVARRLLGAVEPGDRSLREHLVRGRTARLAADGSVGGCLMATARAAIDLVELEARGPELDRMVDWLLGRQGQPGAFSDGCTVSRHQHRSCEHFLGGFFSPAPPSRRAAPVALLNGKEFRVESQARLAASCAALEAVVRSGRRHEPGVERHLDSFASLAEELARWGEFLVPDLIFPVMRALGAAGARWAPILGQLLEAVARHQGPDGTWPQADFFNALDGLTHVGDGRSRPLLLRALPTLLLRQREDGSFGSAAADERALIALRVVLESEN